MIGLKYAINLIKTSTFLILLTLPLESSSGFQNIGISFGSFSTLKLVPFIWTKPSLAPYGGKTHRTFLSFQARPVQTGPKTGFAKLISTQSHHQQGLFSRRPTDSISAALTHLLSSWTVLVFYINNLSHYIWNKFGASGREMSLRPKAFPLSAFSRQAHWKNARLVITLLLKDMTP